MRTCALCKHVLPLEQFAKDASNPSGYRYHCKPCYRIKMARYREYRKDYYAERRETDPEFRKQDKARKEKYRTTEKGKATEKAYAQAHQDQIKKNSSNHYLRNKSQRLKDSKRWREENRERYRAFCRNQNQKRRTTPVGQLCERLRNAMKKAYRKGGVSKVGKTFSLLGYTPQELYAHLAAYLGRPCQCCGAILTEDTLLHLDHIVPAGSARTEEEIIRLNQLENLRLICGSCNLKKVEADLKLIREIKLCQNSALPS